MSLLYEVRTTKYMIINRWQDVSLGSGAPSQQQLGTIAVNTDTKEGKCFFI